MLSLTEAIDFVLWEAEGCPLSSHEIFQLLPRELIDVPVDTKLFWQYFGMYMKNRKDKIGWVKKDGKRRYFLFELM